MLETVDISFGRLAAGYLLLLIPLAILLHQRVPIVRETGMAIVRMTVQLLLVGFYLQVVFQWNHPGVNLAWLVVMVLVADGSIVRGCGLRARTFAVPVFFAVLVGTLIPLLFFIGVILNHSNLLEAQFLIPIGGMVLGNCLRADIVGLRDFYDSVIRHEKAYHQSLAEGAQRSEALHPYLRDAIRSALLPTVATIATVGLVFLPGMMTGVILGGADPMTAIKVQIAIMIIIFSGTALTVYLALLWSIRGSFNGYGLLDRDRVRPHR